MRALTATLLISILALAGCSRGGGAEPAADALDQQAYVAPPVVTSLSIDQDGELTVSGLAAPDERVRLTEMSGAAHGVTADAQGMFSVVLPAGAAADRLISINAQRGDRAVSSDGWLFSPASAPTRAVMLRAGAASLPVGPAPLLAVADVDAGGGLALAGLAPPDTPVVVSVDGSERGRVQSDATGRWWLSLGRPVGSGVHAITVTAGAQRTDLSLDLTAYVPGSALQTTAVSSGIRVDWTLPGGGGQSTIIILNPAP